MRPIVPVMPFAVALLSHPAGAYGCVVSMLAAFVYACHARTIVPLFMAVAAALLTGLAFAHAAPDALGLALLALGTAALQAEFSLPTYGTALLTGLAASGGGSWLLLASSPAASGSLTPAPRLALAAIGTLLLLAAVVRGFRLRTLGVR